MAKLILIALLSTGLFANSCSYYVKGLQKSFNDYDKAVHNQLWSSMDLILYQMESSAKNMVLECDNKRYISLAKKTLNTVAQIKAKVKR